MEPTTMALKVTKKKPRLVNVLALAILNFTVMFIGWAGALLSMLSILMVGYFLHYLDELSIAFNYQLPGLNVNNTADCILTLIILYMFCAMLNIVSSVLLVVGSMQQRYRLLMPWLINTGVFITFNGAYVLYLIIATYAPELHWPTLNVSPINPAINLVIQIIMWTLVYLLFRDMVKKANKKRSDIRSRAIGSILRRLAALSNRRDVLLTKAATAYYPMMRTNAPVMGTGYPMAAGGYLIRPGYPISAGCYPICTGFPRGANAGAGAACSMLKPMCAAGTGAGLLKSACHVISGSGNFFPMGLAGTGIPNGAGLNFSGPIFKPAANAGVAKGNLSMGVGAPISKGANSFEVRIDAGAPASTAKATAVTATPAGATSVIGAGATVTTGNSRLSSGTNPASVRVFTFKSAPKLDDVNIV